MLDESPDAVRATDGSRFVLAVFGKHPAWSDHLEDIGLDTPSLASFKRWLYLDGIRTNLDTGSWEQLPDEHKLPEWNHRLFMTGPKGMLIARIWASSDGRGRRSYPMVAATHLPTTRLPSDLGPMFETLDLVRERCLSATTQDDVLAATRGGKADLENAVKRLSPLPPDGPPADARDTFLRSLDEEAFQRILHVMSSDLAVFSPSPGNRRSSEGICRHFRVPVPATDSERHLLLWHAFFQPHLKPGTIWTAIHPVDAPWADILVGTPSLDTVFQFRITPAGSPVLTEIPYSIPDENRTHFSALLRAFASPGQTLPNLSPDDSNGEKSGSLMGRLFGRGNR